MYSALLVEQIEMEVVQYLVGGNKKMVAPSFMRQPLLISIQIEFYPTISF
jgi:hypothetical protein